MADEVEKETSAARPVEGADGGHAVVSPRQAQKLPYSPPVLRSLGRVAEITFKKSLAPNEAPFVAKKPG